MDFFHRLGLLLVLGVPLLASGSLPRKTLAELAAASDRTVLAQVESQRVNVPGGNVKQMTTISSLQVLERYHGKGPYKVELVQLGGKSGKWKSRLSGDAELKVGEKALMFLRCPDPKVPDECVLVGQAAGKMPVNMNPEGKYEVDLPAQVKGGPVRRMLDDVLEEIRRATPPPAQQERGKR